MAIYGDAIKTIGGDSFITLSGSLVRFTSSKSKPFVSTVVSIVPQQSGSGDPSPDNVRPISGWNEVKIWVRPTHDISATPTVTNQLDDTVYGGTLTINEDGTATGSDEWTKVVLNGSHPIAVTDWRPATGTSAWLYGSSIFNTVKSDDAGYVISDKLKNLSYANEDGIYYGYVGVSTLSVIPYSIAVRVPVEGLNNSALINAYLAENPIEICYKKATPTTISLTAQQINTLVGANNVWADSGDIEVTVYGSRIP